MSPCGQVNHCGCGDVHKHLPESAKNCPSTQQLSSFIGNTMRVPQHQWSSSFAGHAFTCPSTEQLSTLTELNVSTDLQHCWSAQFVCLSTISCWPHHAGAAERPTLSSRSLDTFASCARAFVSHAPSFTRVLVLRMLTQPPHLRADEATQEFQLIQAAYAVLVDPHERQWYELPVPVLPFTASP